MPKRNPFAFTLKEMNERLKQAKDYISAGERVLFAHSDKNIALPDYDPESIDAFLTKSRLRFSDLDRELLNTAVAFDCLSNVVQNTSPDPFTYCRNKTQSRKVGTVVPMFFYKPGRDRVLRYAVCWLGTWHHAPVIAWTDRSAINGRKIESLPFYSDLL